MPLPIKKFDKLTEKPSSQKQTWTLNLSEKCRVLPNWMTNKYGRCKRYGYCDFKGSVGCVARGSA